MFLSTLGATIPSFVFATGFLFVFSKILGLVPSFGVNNWKGYIGPVIVSALFSLGLRGASHAHFHPGRAEPGLHPYRPPRPAGVEGARSKHAMRNAILPVVTYIGPMFAALITGSFVVEKVFGIPGIGNPVHQQYLKPRLHADHGYHRILLRDPGDLYPGGGYSVCAD